MNKLLLNHKARNHIKFEITHESLKPILQYPDDEAERIIWCKNRFTELQNSFDANRLFLAKHKGKGYMISVWEYKGVYYIIQCLRNEFKTFNTVIFVNENLNDSLAIAKFVEQNITEIMSDYKNQLLDARAALVKARIEEQNKVVGEAESNGDA